jgi:hypothetical protein
MKLFPWPQCRAVYCMYYVSSEDRGSMFRQKHNNFLSEYMESHPGIFRCPFEVMNNVTMQYTSQKNVECNSVKYISVKALVNVILHEVGNVILY